MVVFDLINRHIVTKLVICTRIDRGHKEGHEDSEDSEEDNGRSIQLHGF